MIIQFCGLSGSGKTTLAMQVKHLLQLHGISVEIIDGDTYRRTLCADLGFSKADRNENIRRLVAVANEFTGHGAISIVSAINPYEDIRLEIASRYSNVKTVYINCSLDVLMQRDTKQLYRKAMLPIGHPDRVNNLSGVNDPFEVPQHPNLIIMT
ncbi:MAG TPA: adenylyl-sulfate kinase, partial [Mucilaginibacter sp.]|nr:adenylyl-sulfate kinase [Mucilaginibacter sp.]